MVGDHNEPRPAATARFHRSMTCAAAFCAASCASRFCLRSAVLGRGCGHAVQASVDRLLLAGDAGRERGV